MCVSVKGLTFVKYGNYKPFLRVITLTSKQVKLGKIGLQVT